MPHRRQSSQPAAEQQYETRPWRRCVGLLAALPWLLASSPAKPTFEAEISPIDAALRTHMLGVSWHEGCPVALDALVRLEVSHYDFAGEVQRGRVIVARGEAEGLRTVFRKLFEARFPIASLRPVHEFGGDDDRSMAANNSSAFNCRRVGGSKRWSEHAFGAAIDLNPVQNPYVRGRGERRRADPPAGRAYLDRSRAKPGMILREDAVVRAFAAAGWRWGGDWKRARDYQHFSRSGR